MKKIPQFNSEDEEREFWSEQDSTDYIDWTGARPVVLSNLRPSTKTISLRLPEHMIEDEGPPCFQKFFSFESLSQTGRAGRVSTSRSSAEQTIR